jgi:hypothetical protein
MELTDESDEISNRWIVLGVIAAVGCRGFEAADCGCGAAGHTSNASFIKDSSTAGQAGFDRMNLARGICISIRRDVMKMIDEGMSLKEMRAQIEKSYSKYGPPTPTPAVL